MTWGEFDKYAREKMTEGINNVIDWRPAAAFQIDDIVKVKDGEGLSRLVSGIGLLMAIRLFT